MGKANPVPRRRRSPEAARIAILEAAASIFAHKGYHGSTLEDVAGKCGYCPAAIYKHFESKEELFSALWSEMAHRLLSIFEESAIVPMPFELRLRWLVTKLAHLLVGSPDMLIAFIAQRPYAAKHRQTPLERLAYQYFQQHMKNLAELMRQGIAEKALRPGDPADYARLMVGLLYEFAYKWVIADRPPTLPAVLKSADSFLTLFLRGAGSEPPEK
jgi:AcrR family transcriptional regulator